MARRARIKLHASRAEESSRNYGSFYLTIVARNGEPLATSELYINRSNARRAIGDLIDAMRDIVADADEGAAREEGAL